MFELYISIRRSKIKQKILKMLDEPMIASDIAKKLKVYRESVSRALIELEKDKLVNCINPKADRYRGYQITKLGKEIRKKFRAP